ncbi:hypothetical protein M5K25_022902 [Dendrobium thyrsiflorum]|uniref:Uncharacterized protein n=1 Tax=Dendrobium thyrsiflorum TaxID=117978 RepID=A0ABD0U714_DENTH
MEGAAQVAVKAAPSPKSPPKYPDFCGRRRLQLEVQILNREIGFIEERASKLAFYIIFNWLCVAVSLGSRN